MNKKITAVSNNGHDASTFTEREFVLDGPPERMLSEQISAVNFRLRSSDASYSSSWHVAGDPTLLIILSGVFRVELRTGEYNDFAAGDMFIGEDYLDTGVKFNHSLHGHRAEVIGDTTASVLHLKLEKRS